MSVGLGAEGAEGANDTGNSAELLTVMTEILGPGPEVGGCPTGAERRERACRTYAKSKIWEIPIPIMITDAHGVNASSAIRGDDAF